MLARNWFLKGNAIFVAELQLCSGTCSRSMRSRTLLRPHIHKAPYNVCTSINEYCHHRESEAHCCNYPLWACLLKSTEDTAVFNCFSSRKPYAVIRFMNLYYKVCCYALNTACCSVEWVSLSPAAQRAQFVVIPSLGPRDVLQALFPFLRNAILGAIFSYQMKRFFCPAGRKDLALWWNQLLSLHFHHL